MKNSGANLLKLLFDCDAKQKVKGSLELSEIIPSSPIYGNPVSRLIYVKQTGR